MRVEAKDAVYKREEGLNWRPNNNNNLLFRAQKRLQ